MRPYPQIDFSGVGEYKRRKRKRKKTKTEGRREKGREEERKGQKELKKTQVPLSSWLSPASLTLGTRYLSTQVLAVVAYAGETGSRVIPSLSVWFPSGELNQYVTVQFHSQA